MLNYPNNACPCCKVLYYNNEELQELKEIIMNDIQSIIYSMLLLNVLGCEKTLGN